MPAELRPFLAYLATERGLAKNSLEAYRRDLTDLIGFLGPRGKTIRSASGLDYREYMQDQTRLGQSNLTVARRVAAIRAFCKYLAIEGIDKAAEVGQLDRPKPGRSLPKVMSLAQVMKLISAGPDPESEFFHRDVAMLELLYASGLRASEICEVRINDLNMTAGAIRVLGKGHKERVVPVGGPAIEAIKTYMGAVRPQLERGASSDQRIFLSRSGKPLERVALWQIVKRAAERSGVIYEVHPHVLRHCFASHLVEGGADLRVVQELLGHTDVATTQIYTHVDSRRLKALHTKHHPREQEYRKAQQEALDRGRIES